MKRRCLLAAGALVIAGLACSGGPAPTAAPSPVDSAPSASVFDSGRTAFGFFPSPPEPSLESIRQTFRDLGQHADIVLVQQNIPWVDFIRSSDATSQSLTDILNQRALAEQNGLEIVFVVDPLNGLNRREFAGLPPDLAQADFGTPEVRQAYRNFTLRVVRELHPRYLGLASEINTYADAFPDDFPNFVSLYRETYAAVKAVAPQTRIFVTFQWEDLNNLIPSAAEGRTAYGTNWDQVEAFEPELDLWVISSYPFVAFHSGGDIPPDYYTPLLDRTDKPLAVGEGGFISRPTRGLPGDPQDQVAYLDAIHAQIGDRLAFWSYLLLNDFNPQAYADFMRRQGLNDSDIDTLGMFQSVGLRETDGTPKPALAVWDEFRDEARLR